MVAGLNHPVPHFYIAGAPKCGTTALYAYLSAHPRLFLPHDPKDATAHSGLNYKEPHFFAPDLLWRDYTQDPAVYASLYAAAPLEALLGDASVFYLYSQRALPRIRELRPEAKIIVMLRHPVDLLYSLHGHYRYSLAEPEPDFARALELDRPFPLVYRPVARLGAQLQRVYRLFPRDQVHVIWHEDFAADTAACVAETCRFLGVEPPARGDFARHNAQKQLRSPTLQRLLLWRPRAAQRLARQLLPARLRHRAATALLDLNRREQARPPLDPQVRATLTRDFADDIALLAELTGRSLDHWMKP
ncbi:MAG: sulfotransferase [Puniceicoccaceae bacterium 5H]|nr:MAG: sulfotransferase [Puniceicoccaceae bacterium 5H]